MSNFFSTVLALMLIFGIVKNVKAQSSTGDTQGHTKSNWFISSSMGIQMSGIKSEDFIKSNYSPLINVSIGKWFSRELAIQFGYRGKYFNAISDDVKHYYNYFYGDVIFNINDIIFSQKHSIYKLFVHTGSGYFYNYEYGRPNICANFTLSNNLNLNDDLFLKLEISAVMGWDIYQGDEDILPSLSMGISYSL